MKTPAAWIAGRVGCRGCWMLVGELSCGPGRNALHLASAGFTVAAVDLSPTAIAWATDRAREAGAEVHFHCGDAFAFTATRPGLLRGR